MRTKNLFRAISGIASAAVLVGCASGPAFQAPELPPTDRAQLYIYRPLALAGGALVHKVSIDGTAETLSLPNASWRRVVLAPGSHTVAVKDFLDRPCGALGIDLQRGQTAYLANKTGTQAAGLNAYSITCTLVSSSSDQAIKAMSGLAGAQ